MTPSDWSLLTLLVFVCIQLFFLVAVVGRLIFFRGRKSADVEKERGVSVIVCAWNEFENLKELLPELDDQDYPRYEVLVVDDRSDDGSEAFLKDYCLSSPHVRTVRIKERYDHITPKKYALTIGQKHAKYEVSLMTDADCRPSGRSWIRSMMSCLAGENEIVLGFSPYLKERGLLNWFIRCETFYTAVQYFSFAVCGLAYMGVGRNLMYLRRLFFENRGFYGHSNVLGGDDDLFINRVSKAGNTACNLDSEGFMVSIPKKTWREWFVQKRRHLGVGRLYRPHFRFLLGLLAGSHVITWMIALVNLVWALVVNDTFLLAGTGVLFGVRMLVQWVILASVNHRLGSTISSFFIPLADFALFVYYLFMGGYNLFNKQPVVKWR